jgi:hypothetical protein
LSFSEPFDTRSHLLDHAGNLVTQNGRQRESYFAPDHVQIAVTNSTGCDLHKYFLFLRLGFLQVFEKQSPAHFP